MSAPVSVNLGPDGTSSSEWPAIVEAHPTSFKIEVKLNQEIFLDMELTNTTQSLVSFKVKTTARDRYLLRPTQDYIPPNSTKSCKIVMARLSEWPDLSNPKNAKDKFLVQSCILKEPVADLSKMWKDLESIHTPKQNRFAYHEQRVKCKLSLPKSKEKEKDKNDKSAATPDPLSPTSATTSTSTRIPSRPASPAPAPAPSVPTANIASFIQSQSTPATTTSTSTSVSGSTSARDVDDDVDDEGGMVSARGKESETVTALRLSLERKQRELDELMDFVVKLTAHNERLKAETGTLQSTVKKNQEQISTYQQRIQTLQEQVQTQQERPETPVQPMPVIHAEPGEGEGLRHRQREQGEPETVIPKETRVVTNNGIQMWLVALIAMLAFVLGYVFK